MGQYVQNVPVKFYSSAVTVGTPVVLDTMSYPYPMTVIAVPAGGGSLLVEYSCTPYAAGNAGAATWIAWPGGTVAVTTTDALIAPVAAMRFTATTAAGTVTVTA